MLEALESGTSSESESNSLDESNSSHFSPKYSNLADCSSNGSSTSSSGIPERKLVVVSSPSKGSDNSSNLMNKPASQVMLSEETVVASSKPSKTVILQNSPKTKRVVKLVLSDSDTGSLKSTSSSNGASIYSSKIPNIDDSSNSSDIPLSKFVSKDIKIASSVSSTLSDTEALQEVKYESNITVSDSLTKDYTQKARKHSTKECSEIKSNLKRKRSNNDESDYNDVQLSAKIKRKISNLSSGSDKDTNINEKSPPQSAVSEVSPAKNSSKTPNVKYKPGPASSKKKTNSEKYTDRNATPRKTEENTDFTNSKISEIQNRKLDSSGILERLEISSGSNDTSDQSEEDESPLEQTEKQSSISKPKLRRKRKLKQEENSKIIPKQIPSMKSDKKRSQNHLEPDDETSNKPVEEEPNGSTSSENENDSVDSSPTIKKEEITKKSEKSNKKDLKENVTKKPGDNPRIVRLQRYLKEAGIRVQNYKILWQNCKNDKARAEKLLELLHERGLKGKPSVSECRKIKRRFEREKEISELSKANIITTEGRPRRSTASLYTSHRSPSSEIPSKKESSNTSQEFKKSFSRLRSIVDSEESD